MKLTLEEIRKLCIESSFERGIEYFKAGKVANLKQVEDKITATVEGTEDYQVTIYKNNHEISASCSCPYDWRGCCKHMWKWFPNAGIVLLPINLPVVLNL